MEHALTIVVTRPAPQGEELCKLLQAKGARAIWFPTLAIVPLPDVVLPDVMSLDWLIFTSPQAVSYSTHWLSALIQAKTQLAAVGQGTARALQQAGYPVQLIPAEWNSEGLLAHTALQKVQAKKILLVQGENGRGLLQRVLAERGAAVLTLDVYRRQLPLVDAAPLIQLVRARQIDCLVCASGEALQNLKKLTSSVWLQLAAIPLVVVSPRLAAVARELGFITIRIAKNASHEAMIAALQLPT